MLRKFDVDSEEMKNYMKVEKNRMLRKFNMTERIPLSSLELMISLVRELRRLNSKMVLQRQFKERMIVEVEDLSNIGSAYYCAVLVSKKSITSKKL